MGRDSYCSDELIFDKRQCEAGYKNGSCEEYCKFNPEDPECADVTKNAPLPTLEAP